MTKATKTNDGIEHAFCDICGDDESTLSEVEFAERLPDYSSYHTDKYVLCRDCLKDLKDDPLVEIKSIEVVYFTITID